MRRIELKLYAKGIQENHTYRGVPNSHWDEKYIATHKHFGDGLSAKHTARKHMLDIMELRIDNPGEAIDAYIHLTLENLEYTIYHGYRPIRPQ